MLINCVAYEDGKRVAEIAPADISEYLKRPANPSPSSSGWARASCSMR